LSFVSWPFAILFALVFAARLTIGRWKNEPEFIVVLIAAGAIFYGWFVPAYLLILLASTTVDYFAARLIAAVPMEQRVRRRTILTASLGTNLGLLGFFKYGNLAARAASEIARALGIPFTVGPLDVVLPIGISFYTFEAMSYTIDVYRGVIVPERSFAKFFLFISFFPHLVAGPIVRAGQFLPQIPRPRRLRAAALYEGVWLITTGYFLKTVCADNLAAYVNEHWHEAYDPGAGASMAWSLTLMFSGQIFADFAGYSNIARGLAYLLGYRLPVNFNAPYIAGSFRNFWERWHITLSRWLRDYLYLPLGGNRISPRRTYLNLLVVMLLGGLWHGAALTFVVWGGLHGCALALERALGFHRDNGRIGLMRRVAWCVTVQVVVLIAWVFFRSDTLAHAVQFVRTLFSPRMQLLPSWAYAAAVFLLPIAVLHVWTLVEEREWLPPITMPVRAAIATAMMWAIVMLPGRTSAFIYFQF